MFIIHRVCCYICASLGCGIYAGVYDKAARQKKTGGLTAALRECEKALENAENKKYRLLCADLLFFARRLYP